MYSCFYNQPSDINTLLSLIYSKVQAAATSNEASCNMINDYVDQTPLSIQSNNSESFSFIGQLNFFNDNFWLVTSTFAEDNIDQLPYDNDFVESSPLTQGNQMLNIFNVIM